MMTITLEDANRVLEALRTNGTMTHAEVLSRGMSKEEYTENGWTYTIFFDHGTPKKIEAYNHRELIEQWVK